jgi:hypothetical protein
MNIEKWNSPSEILRLANQAIKYYVELIVSIKTDNQPFRFPCTGFLLEIDDALLWVTAGHVIESITKYIEEKKVIEMRWIDRFEVKGAETLPFTSKHIKCFLRSTEVNDYGAILLSIYEAEHFKRNNNLRPLKMRMVSEEYIGIIPEGFILAGFPWDYVKISTKKVVNNKELVQYTSRFVCLPVEKIPWEDIDYHKERWSDGNAFYGKVIPYSEDKMGQPSEFKGISGGLIFAINRKDNFIDIVIYGVFDSYNTKTRIIRGEPIGRVLDNLHGWIKEMNSH